jgi:hypothetical protein
VRVNSRPRFDSCQVQRCVQSNLEEQASLCFCASNDAVLLFKADHYVLVSCVAKFGTPYVCVLVHNVRLQPVTFEVVGGCDGTVKTCSGISDVILFCCINVLLYPFNRHVRWYLSRRHGASSGGV